MYDDGEYANTRLEGTLVRHKGRAVLVLRVKEDLRAVIEDLEKEDTTEVCIDDLNLQSPPLGFVNVGSHCLYLARRPMRRDWRQGVRPNSVRALVGRVERLSTREIASCINGVFPSVDEALQILKEQPSVAVSRDFMLSVNGVGTVVIKYKWYGKVGVLKGTTANFTKKFSYLPTDLRGCYE